MAAAVLLSVVLGMVVQEQRTSAQRVRWNLELDRRLSEATRELQFRVEELAAYAAVTRRTRVAEGVADVVLSHGAAPGESGQIRLGPSPAAGSGHGVRPARPAEGSRQGTAGQGSGLLPSARLSEQVQRVIRTYPLPVLYPWDQFERFVGEEIERCRSLLIVFSIIEIRIEEYTTARTDAHDRDLALRRVVDLLQASLRRVDILSCNGAGRFAVVLPRVPKVHALEKARDLVARLETDDVATGLLRCEHLALTAGVVSFPEDGSRARDLLAGIETDVMRSHRTGRPCWDR
jgi:diguanylate cyclase (GGDEF)-like protein